MQAHAVHYSGGGPVFSCSGGMWVLGSPLCCLAVYRMAQPPVTRMPDITAEMALMTTHALTVYRLECPAIIAYNMTYKVRKTETAPPVATQRTVQHDASSSSAFDFCEDCFRTLSETDRLIQL